MLSQEAKSLNSDLETAPSPKLREVQRTPGCTKRGPLGDSAKLRRLNELSVSTAFDPIEDIDWDNPDYAVDLDDPIWISSAKSTLTQTQWFKELPKSAQLDLCLDIIAQRFGVGIEFENILQRGLLQFAHHTLPFDSPEFRYCHHEVIEESRHQIMFKMLLERLGRDGEGIPKPWSYLTPMIVRFSTLFPELFFFYVLGGEEPIDHFQRGSIKDKKTIHPLLHRVMQIHVIEETRHLSFAHMFLAQRLKNVSRFGKMTLSRHVPILLRLMINIMLVPSRNLRRKHKIPRAVMKEAFYNNPEFKDELVKCVSNTRAVAKNAGLITPWTKRFWALLGIS